MAELNANTNNLALRELGNACIGPKRRAGVDVAGHVTKMPRLTMQEQAKQSAIVAVELLLVRNSKEQKQTSLEGVWEVLQSVVGLEVDVDLVDAAVKNRVELEWLYVTKESTPKEVADKLISALYSCL